MRRGLAGGAVALAAAIAQAKVPLPAADRGYTMVKSISARQRPRRPDA